MVIKWCVWQVECHTVTFNLLNRFYSVLNEVFALERLQCIPIHPHPCFHRKRWQRFWELPTFTLRRESPWTSRVWSGWTILSIMLVVFMVRLDHFIEVITFRSGTAQNHHSSYSGSTMTRSPLEFYCLRSCSILCSCLMLSFDVHTFIYETQAISYDSPRGGVSQITEKGETTASFLLIQVISLRAETQIPNLANSNWSWSARSGFRLRSVPLPTERGRACWGDGPCHQRLAMSCHINSNTSSNQAINQRIACKVHVLRVLVKPYNINININMTTITGADPERWLPSDSTPPAYPIDHHLLFFFFLVLVI